MEYDFKLQAFTLMEMVIVLMLLGVLASLAIPKLMHSRHTICKEKLMHSIKLINANLIQAQTKAFLLNSHTFTPDLQKLAQPFIFNQNDCSLQILPRGFIISMAHQQGMFLLQQISGSYQFVCSGELCLSIGY